MKIEIQPNVFVEVDERDACFVRRYTHSLNGAGYVSGGGQLLHRVIMGHPKGMDVAHKNHNKLDCTRNNLEVITHQQNKQRDPVRSDNTSGLKGVTWVKRSKRWQAQICVMGGNIHLGTYLDFFEACCARKSGENRWFS